MFWQLSRFGSSRQQRILLAENHPSTLPVHLGGQWGISKPAKKYNLQSVSWVGPRAFSQYHTPETPCLGGITEAYSSDAQTNLTLLQKLTTCHDGVGCMFMFATGGVKWSWVRKQNKIDWENLYAVMEIKRSSGMGLGQGYQVVTLDPGLVALTHWTQSGIT